ncbi:hypothetical protein Q5O_20740 [Pseudomonas putida JB]|uniref:hypothetical protein n=1 Tax=Pseudomonas putida TaxID=303 RepID=UPI000877F6F9|nr:hypothetical protein [Pseudomonas putida]AOX10709.1 hypothetical protein Q5O_20740 [Pseudomonas putida JB]
MGNNLTVSRQTGRVDVLLSVSEHEMALDSLPLFNDYVGIASEVIPVFSGLSSYRLAVGGVVLLPVESAKAGYELLQSFLPFVSFEDDMSDFFLQINRKRKIDQSHVNELTKWSCVAFRRLVVAGDKVGQVDSDLHSVRIEFDINNPGTDKLISGEDLIARLRDFIVRAERITLEGAR